MGPLPLGEGHLAPRQIEKHRAAAPGTGIQRHQIAVSPAIQLAGGFAARGGLPSGRVCSHAGSRVMMDLRAEGGAGVLVRAHKQAAANGTQLRLVVHSAVVLRSLRLVQMDSLLPICPTLSQALAAGPAPAP